MFKTYLKCSLSEFNSIDITTIKHYIKTRPYYKHNIKDFSVISNLNIAKAKEFFTSMYDYKKTTYNMVVYFIIEDLYSSIDWKCKAIEYLNSYCTYN
jgi:hypothetical protein